MCVMYSLYLYCLLRSISYTLSNRPKAEFLEAQVRHDTQLSLRTTGYFFVLRSLGAAV